MKKTMKLGVFCLLTFFGFQFAQAQSYESALGLGIDLGNGSTLVGPQYKYFFDSNTALNGQVLFGGDMTTVGADYSYNQSLGAAGLNWYVGVGPQLTFLEHGGGTWFAIRPAVGLEYKIPSAPLGVHFDWKPWWNLSKESDFEAGRFSMGFKYVW